LLEIAATSMSAVAAAAPDSALPPQA